MKPWEVWQWEFPQGSHPAVIVSPRDRCANPDIAVVNVLGCSTQRARRHPEVHEDQGPLRVDEHAGNQTTETGLLGLQSEIEAQRAARSG